MNPTDFASRIRQKYPGAYDNVPDLELAQRVVAKYPTYASQVKFEEQKTSSDRPVGPFKDSIAYKVGNALTSSEQNFGQDIAGAASNVLPESVTGVGDIKKAADAHAQDVLNLTKLIKNREASGYDATALKKGLENEIQNAPPQWADLYPSLNKTALQVLGDAGGVALDIAAAGSLKGAKGFSLAPKLTQTAEEVAKASEAYKALSTGAKVASIAKTTAKTAATGAAIGYGYDVTQKAQNNEADLTPGLGTAIGVAVPLAIGGAKIAGAITKEQAPRLINSLIGTRKGDFSYGKNPGRAIAESGITANSLPDLEDKVTQARQTAGSTIGEITNKLEEKAQVQINNALNPIDEAINQAQKAPRTNASLIERLQNVKDDLLGVTNATPEDIANVLSPSHQEAISNVVTELENSQKGYRYQTGYGKDAITKGVSSTFPEWVPSELRSRDLFDSIKGNIESLTPPSTSRQKALYEVIVNEINNRASSLDAENIWNGVKKIPTNTNLTIQKRNLNDTSFANAFDLKKTVGDVTKFTGNVSDDGIVNGALKRVYGNIKGAMNEAALKADPELGKQLLKANEKYADFTSAQVALKNRIALNQGKNLISMPIKVGSVAGVLTSIGTGGAGVPAVLAAVGAGLLDKALSSTAVKTRVASWLAKESPVAVAEIVAKNPGIGGVLKKAFSKEYTPIEDALQHIKDVPNKQGGFIRVGETASSVTPELVAKKMDKTDLAIVKDYLAKNDVSTFMKARPTLDAMGIGNLDEGTLKRFLNEVVSMKK